MKFEGIAIPDLAGVSDVARWCGTSPWAVTNWLVRYEDCPVPVGRRGSRTGKFSYFWSMQQKAEWLAWAGTKGVWSLTS